MRPNSPRSLSLLLLSLAFAGCILETAAPVVPDASGGAPEAGGPASGAPGLPPGDFIAFYDGAGMAAAPYEIQDGQVVVDGDIILGDSAGLLGADRTEPRALGKSSGNILGTAMPGQANSWPSGRIPYVIETDAARKDVVISAIQEWNERAAVIWVPKTSADADYVAFVNTTANNPSSSVGKRGGRQVINISSTAKRTLAMHEMGHAAGLYHEQQRSDRSTNVNTSFSSHQVEIGNADFAQMGASVGPYDHKSIMHYPAQKHYYVWNADCGCWKYSNTPTSEWIWLENQAGKPAIEPSPVLSAGDILTLRSMYMTALPYDAATSKSTTTGLDWAVVRPFKSGGLNFILHYNPASGQFRTYPFSASQGMIDNPVETGFWNPGWSMIEFYVIGSQTYALFYNRTSGWSAFYTMNANGKLGSFIESQGWSPSWDLARIYKPTGVNQRYIFLYNKGSGLAQIYALKANGALDLDKNTYSQTLFGYEDFQTLEDVRGDWSNGGNIISNRCSFLLYHDQHSSTQFLQKLTTTGGLGQWMTTAAIGTGYTQAIGYARNKRSEVLYYNKATGKMLIYDVRPTFSGDGPDPVMTSPGLAILRSHTSSANYQVYTFNLPWGTDPVGAERLLLFDPGLKRFWNSNLVPYPSIP